MTENNFRILLIEDDADISDLIKLQLQLKSYKVETTATGAQALELINKQSFDLFIVDRMLPDTNGLDICRYIRNTPITSNSPILLVTALSEADNIIEGLDAGADDYITKPFDINVLHARVRAQLRRLKRDKSQEGESLKFGQLEINEKRCEVKIKGELIGLTHTEFQILTVLATEPGIVHTRQKLIKTILGEDVHVTNRTIDTHIAGLRKKMGDTSNLIETIRGVGYRLQDNET